MWGGADQSAVRCADSGVRLVERRPITRTCSGVTSATATVFSPRKNSTIHPGGVSNTSTTVPRSPGDNPRQSIGGRLPAYGSSGSATRSSTRSKRCGVMSIGATFPFQSSGCAVMRRGKSVPLSTCQTVQTSRVRPSGTVSDPIIVYRMPCGVCRVAAMECVRPCARRSARNTSGRSIRYPWARKNRAFGPPSVCARSRR